MKWGSLLNNQDYFSWLTWANLRTSGFPPSTWLYIYGGVSVKKSERSTPDSKVRPGVFSFPSGDYPLCQSWPIPSPEHLGNTESDGFQKIPRQPGHNDFSLCANVYIGALYSEIASKESDVFVVEGLMVVSLMNSEEWHQTKPRWWFQIFFMFTPTWRRFPFWLIFLKWVETTN